MAIINFSVYKDLVTSPYQRNQDTKASRANAIAGRISSLWTTAPNEGSIPTSAEAPTRETVGAIGQQNSDGVQRIAQVICSLQQSGNIIICDRLSHQGGLSATSTSAQTTNLPTAALTRYTTGAGVFIGLEIYEQIGETATTVIVSYTNQAGTSGRTSPTTVFGGTGFRNVQNFIIVPLAAGDTGVRSVQSVTLAGSTGTDGDFGVTLFKPLFSFPVYNMGAQQFLFDSILNMCGNMPQVVNNACLWYLARTFTTSTGIWSSSIRFIEE